MSRAVPEWVGKTDDAAIPARVKLRILRAHDGRCAISGHLFVEGDRIEFDHKIPLSLGGEHAEGNLQPITSSEHKVKTVSDVGKKAKADRIQKNRHGFLKPKRIVPGSKASPWGKRLDGTVFWRDK